LNIANMRLKAGMTQRELSGKIGVAISTVAMWETGKSFPKTSMLPKLTQVLNCTADELLGIGQSGPAGSASCGEENERRGEI